MWFVVVVIEYWEVVATAMASVSLVLCEYLVGVCSRSLVLAYRALAVVSPYCPDANVSAYFVVLMFVAAKSLPTVDSRSPFAVLSLVDRFVVESPAAERTTLVAAQTSEWEKSNSD